MKISLDIFISFCVGQRHQKACRRKEESGAELQVHKIVNNTSSPTKIHQDILIRREVGYVHQESNSASGQFPSAPTHLTVNVDGLF